VKKGTGSGSRKTLFKIWLIVAITLMSVKAYVQQLPPKEVTHFTQFWTSINANARISDKWSIIGDFHMRRNSFLKEPGFYLIRTGAAFRLRSNMAVAAGYAHLWSAGEKINGKYFFLNENRVYEQAILTHPAGKINILHRIRNEQRWIEYTVNNTPSGNFRFTNRVRYLLSLKIPLSDNPKYPQLVLADEIMLHFGKAVTHSNFEQNRIFVGLNQPISKTLSFDIGYMYIYQLRINGYQYNASNVFRLFFYYNPYWSKQKHDHAKVNDHHSIKENYRSSALQLSDL
jgi:Protein of unknown function (DUF2490)